MVAARASKLLGSEGDIPTLPGDERLPNRGVVAPTIPIGCPCKEITVLLAMLLGWGGCPSGTTNFAKLLSVLKSRFALKNGNLVPG